MTINDFKYYGFVEYELEEDKEVVLVRELTNLGVELESDYVHNGEITKFSVAYLSGNISFYVKTETMMTIIKALNDLEFTINVERKKAAALLQSVNPKIDNGAK